MNVSSGDIKKFQKKVLDWYSLNVRDLPWRQTKNPYHILVSEVMSQQTQVDRVLKYYRVWLGSLPDFVSLSQVGTKELLGLWSGLGYNSRALRLRELAKIVVDDFGGLLPDDYDELVKLPGIGDYTASAVLAFAFDRDVPVVDTNVRRVLIHEFDLPEKTSLNELRLLAERCIPKGKSSLWHNALMDYGSLVLTSKVTGIAPTSKQSKFKGSDREVRGFITRELIKKDSISIDYIKKNFADKDVDSIVGKMVKNGIVKKKGRNVVLV